MSDDAATEIVPGWETVIGLEVHAELATATKLFCDAPNQFGGEPNTNIDPVSLGLPGSLPVLNEQAVELAIRVGLALHCRVQRSVFARKNYFYPDMPKDFQISQFDLPINEEGWLELADGRQVGIERAHLEEDTGKSTHVGGGGRIHEAGYSLVDYNRAGVPLIEIVGAPDLRSAEDARAYVSELRSILVAIGASDGKMEEGSMRVDCNVSVRPMGDPDLGTRCEVKNINSLRSLGRAIVYESRRQVDLITSGDRVEQQTRHWNEDEGRTHKLRSKEEAYDYRYFPEPDLVPLDPSAEWIESVRSALPLLPRERRHRLADAAGVDTATASLTVERGMDDLAVEALAAGADPSRVLVHVENNLADGSGLLTAASFVSLVAMEVGGDLTATQAKTVLAVLVADGGEPAEVAAGMGFEAMDDSALEAIVDGLIAEYDEDWAAFTSGDDKERKKKSGFFVGQIMKATNGQADGRVVNELLSRRANG
ncbi:MAG: Asp-tRNA(Asn)/Glu-tRNA(Gln) amidotransferase subunit GatB [Acidimicrobiales bacterium]|jgi:aspartyl-tRNA(Asn)/glutamyl-tRNA(Gln) amidotransferase subunit B|nr:Asp-tRNA(Asn)/Glu-tRNA(Gln) amidotransferase subunit GatB [Actinomycetes bacterium]MDP6286706.1 Asp-tRNA(Asn)/Glu-tRNA(Gln) amidotransferase subunit GatB [Acidimicrobiales bacterium]HCW00384.1 Asp-tRNA(Asn)/Glu-tRNA(Gln) amidotransferase subunit GatB [Acidimicrobiaceae bacterium]MDP6910043.1 Asp-tRNA(Asn)/Glu-tRNA(Gln) amidotransferase subunit GatB [Acidimicrobiales bacterium]HJM72117.1 Asp-tRNA(Asn)/Glu-tRNA(Gln) amidotransferase subunit GatB [Acidimicrobiales bacterium]|tara:strand:- start:742 stop:2187 length:1446 start_codon:yes stop_codon:yes gene_type:complete